MEKKRSNFTELVTEICEEEGIKRVSFSDDWSHRLEKDGKHCFLVGYQFPVNKASSKELCQDKALTYDVLTAAGIPAAKHLFLPGNSVKNPGAFSGNLAEALEMLRTCGRVVLKDNYGTGGNRVYLAESEAEFHDVLEQILSTSYAACASPFYTIEEEYRVVMADGVPGVIFRKERASETGADGEKHYLTWKHNLGQGAQGIPVYEPELRSVLGALAERTAAELDMRFCSVDIIRTEGNFYRVLEVNGGVMMEHFSGQDEACRALAKETYRKAILKSFENTEAE